MSKAPLAVKVARWSATHPWRAMVLWVVFVAACFSLGSLTGTNSVSEDDQNIGEVSRAGKIAEAGQFENPAVENVLITARAGGLDKAAGGRAAAAVKTTMRKLGDVASVADPVPAPNGDALLVRVTFKKEVDEPATRLQPLLDATAAVQRDHPSLRVEQIGESSMRKALTDSTGDDFKKAELFSIPVTLAILLLAFGALIAAGIPLLLALSAVAAAIGLSTAASHLVPSVEEVNSVILLIGLAVGVDYSLFYLRREREERAKGHAGADAVEIAAATSGHAVIVSGLAVIVSMAGLFLAGDAVFSSFAVGSILVVAVAVIGSLTVLPAVLGKLGPWVDRPRIPLLWRLASRTGKPRFWPFVLKPALKFPAVALVLSVAGLLALAAPALDMNLKFPDRSEQLSPDLPVMVTYHRMTNAFPSTGTTHQVAVRAPAEAAGAVSGALATLVERTRGNPLFAQDGLSKARVSADGTVTVMSVATPYGRGTDEAHRALATLRDLVPATVGTVAGAQYAVGGEVAVDVDYAAHVREKLPLVIGFVLVLTFVVMVLTFRSVVVALTAIVLNLLSAGAAYGLLTWVFQDNSWAEGLLDFRSNDAVVSWLPLFLFVVLFGLSMDYHVFVVSRIREAALNGMPTRQAVAEGITGSAGVITSAAAVMVAVFSIFATLSDLGMKQTGVGLAAAIFIDATLIRAIILPSLMILLGRANWWAPKFLRRRGEKLPEPTEKRELVTVG